MVDNKMGEIALDQLRTIDKSRLKGKLATLTENKRKELHQLLRQMFEE